MIPVGILDELCLLMDAEFTVHRFDMILDGVLTFP